MKQTEWKEELVEFYDARPASHPRDLWCLVMKDWGVATNHRAAHIAPYKMGYKSAAWMFGAAEDEGYSVIWKLQNGMITDRNIVQGFDEGYFVLLPVPKPAPEPIGWRVRLINKETEDERIGNGELKWKVVLLIIGENLAAAVNVHTLLMVKSCSSGTTTGQGNDIYIFTLSQRYCWLWNMRRWVGKSQRGYDNGKDVGIAGYLHPTINAI